MYNLLTYIKSSSDPEVYYIPEIDRYTYEKDGVKHDNYYRTAEDAKVMLVANRWLDISTPACEGRSLLQKVPLIDKECGDWWDSYLGNMQDVILDIETLDTQPGAVILSIGAVYFNRNTGITGKQFYHKIDLQSCLDAGFTINTDTLCWWMQQDENARKNAFGNKDDKGVDIRTALYEFFKFLGGEDNRVTVWGNGSDFDNSIISYAWNKLGIDSSPMWKFWNSRCVRTVVDIGLSMGYDFKNELEFDGVKHDPVDDAKFQVKYLTHTLNALFNKD